MTLASRSQTALPLEILLNIVELIFSIDTWESVLLKQHQLLLVNRELYNRLLHVFYRTVSLKTPTQAALFLHTIRLSPHLGRLVCNLWISASTSDALTNEAGLSLKLLSIYTPNLQRLSIPKLPQSRNPIKLKQESFLPHLHTLCVHSMPKRAFFLYGIPDQLKNLQRIFVTVPPEKEQGELEISTGLWVMALVAIVGEKPTCITELVIKVPAHSSNEACVGEMKIKSTSVAISMVDTSLNEERTTYDRWLQG